MPPIALNFGVDPNSVALLSTAFALPFALVQPVLGPVADMVGKIRVMLVCLAVLLGATLLSAFATDYTVLLVARIVAGIASGGIFPVGIAVIGDLDSDEGAPGRDRPLAHRGHHRQPARRDARRDHRRPAGWRTVFFVFAAGGAFALITAVVTLRAGGARPRHAFRYPRHSRPLRGRVRATRGRKCASPRCSPRAL